MIIVSYYTEKYAAHAETLKKSLRKLGYRHDLERVSDRGSWRENTALKPAFLRRKLDEFKGENAIVWIDVDAEVHRPLEFLERLRGCEIAVYRHLSATAYHSREWHNFGQVWNGTIYLRVSTFTRRIMDEWVREQSEHPTRLEQKNLAAVLARTDPSKLVCLPPEYCWVEKYMRPLSPNAHPVIEHFMVGDHGHRKIRSRTRKPKPPTGPEVLWSGHAYDFSGYAKANREVLLRVAHTVKVQLSQVGLSQEPILVDEYTKARLDVHLRTVVGPRAPLVRFYTPQAEDSLSDRYRVCWTMLETHPRVHPRFTYVLNENYHEVWTPTEWGARVFRDSGLKIPCEVIPLGIDTEIFRPPLKKDCKPFPRARLLTTRRCGTVERPKGRIFLSVCQPTFRKGLDVLVKAWEDAHLKDASLVVYTGIHERLEAYGAAPWRKVNQAKARTAIYQLTGRRTEVEMAELYQAADVYITTSRGEGFDLPLLEASACGLPIIAPDHTSHRELAIPADARLMVSPDDYRPVPISKKISEWYEGQSFAWYGKVATAEFAEAIQRIPTGKFWWHDETKVFYNWNRAAQAVVKRILERCP